MIFVHVRMYNSDILIRQQCKSHIFTLSSIFQVLIQLNLTVYMFICLNQICLPSYKFTEIVIVRHIDIRSTCRSLLRNIKFNRYTSFISNLYSLKKIVVILYNYRLLPFLSQFSQHSLLIVPLRQNLYPKPCSSRWQCLPPSLAQLQGRPKLELSTWTIQIQKLRKSKRYPSR